jgi:hypothetical protein
MKSNLNKLLVLVFTSLLMFTACQTEKVDEINPTEGDLVTKSSEVAFLVANMTTRDGSYDNIMDRNHCTSIALPVTVVIHGLEIIIDSEADLEVIERIFDEFDEDLDELDFVFPITVILADHTEVVIENNDQLQNIINDCQDDDDDIECIDFEYPIMISVYDDNNEKIGTETFANDEQLYRFFHNLKENQFVSFNFPMSLKDSEGQVIRIENNEQLREAIRIARNECDEDDDDDYNDDDFDLERLNAYLTECLWVVHEVIIDDIEKTPEYVDYKFDFKETGGVIATRVVTNDGFIEGTWTTSLTDRGVLMTLDFGANELLSNQWLVYDVGEGKIKLYDQNSRVRFTQRCADETPTEERFKAVMTECLWHVKTFNLNGDDVSAQYEGYAINYKVDGTVIATVPGSTSSVAGSWGVQMGDSSLFFLWDMAQPLQDLSNDWKLYEMSDSRVKFISSTSYIILERHCPNPNDGDVIAIKNFMMEGAWAITDYNDSGVDETTSFANYFFVYYENGLVKAFNPNEVVEAEGSWDVIRNSSGGLRFILNMGEAVPFDELMDDWKIVSTSALKLELKDISGSDGTTDILKFEQY